MNQELSVWSLIIAGEFDSAVSMADEEFNDTGNILSLRNKIFALFHLKKYSDVVALSEKLIEYRRGETDVDFIYLGIANWILGNVSQAIDAFQKAQNCRYKDAAGGIEIYMFLYFIGVKINQDKLKLSSIKAIKKLLKSKRSINWPGPIGNYLLNEITETQLLSYASDIPILKERQLCQAYFAIAIKNLESNEIDGYLKNLNDCISYGQPSYLETAYYMAKGELESKRNDVL